MSFPLTELIGRRSKYHICTVVEHGWGRRMPNCIGLLKYLSSHWTWMGDGRESRVCLSPKNVCWPKVHYFEVHSSFPELRLFTVVVRFVSGVVLVHSPVYLCWSWKKKKTNFQMGCRFNGICCGWCFFKGSFPILSIRLSFEIFIES